MTTTKDIAARLNLSVSTVGRALADDRRISAETKFRVQQAAVELGYVGNRAARLMRGERSTVIGLVVPDVGNSFYSTVAHALAETMNAHQRQVMLCETGDDRHAELRHIRDLAAAQVGGVVIVPTAKPLTAVARLLQTMPHVQLVRRVPSLGPHWFGIDDRSVIHAATSHLLELGHERIGYIGGIRDIPTASARLAGFEDAIAGAGLPPDSGLIRLGPPSSASHGAAAVRALVRSAYPADRRGDRLAADHARRPGRPPPGRCSRPPSAIDRGIRRRAGLLLVGSRAHHGGPAGARPGHRLRCMAAAPPRNPGRQRRCR